MVPEAEVGVCICVSLLHFSAASSDLTELGEGLDLWAVF